MNEQIEQKILKCSLLPLPKHLDELSLVLSGPTGKTSAGFPYIMAESFEHFLQHVPHLFSDGNAILDWLSGLRSSLEEEMFTSDEYLDVLASIRVIETVVHTAAITSVPDCWVLKWVLSAWKNLGALDLLAQGPVTPGELRQVLRADERLFANDLSLLICRGVLTRASDGVIVCRGSVGENIVKAIKPVPADLPGDLTDAFVAVFSPPPPPQEARILIQKLLSEEAGPADRYDWCPTLTDIELGFSLVPVVLALRLNNQTERLRIGRDLKEVVADMPVVVHRLLLAAAYIDASDRVTRLGDRVFSRGPGPIGIIHAYHPYMKKLSELTRGEDVGSQSKIWVERGKNVAASQDANRKTFEMANQSLDAFCKQSGFRFQVFVEHAVGQGEATRQRFRKPEGETKQYFGADLEDDAINAAIKQQQAGTLPANMQFVRKADIGQPQLVIDAVRKAGFASENAVMMVGNGFHEVRQQSNEKMVQVFRGYCDAGILLIFTEESGLSDSDLLATGWNTYHAGFRYVHELSGQGLRPAVDRDDAPDGRFSWGKCATLAGYRLLKTYTTRTRKIFPYPRKDGYNPAISVNYFCVPASMAEELGLDPVDFQKFN